jgi:hypothetical protein
MEANAEIMDTFKDLGDEIMATNIGPTLEKDKTKTRIEALHAIYKILRP